MKWFSAPLWRRAYARKTLLSVSAVHQHFHISIITAMLDYKCWNNFGFSQRYYPVLSPQIFRDHHALRSRWRIQRPSSQAERCFRLRERAVVKWTWNTDGNGEWDWFDVSGFTTDQWPQWSYRRTLGCPGKERHGICSAIYLYKLVNLLTYLVTFILKLALRTPTFSIFHFRNPKVCQFVEWVLLLRLWWSGKPVETR